MDGNETLAEAASKDEAELRELEIELDESLEEEIPEMEVDIFDILRTVSDALRELFERVERLEKRPQFAATIKGK